MQKNILGYLPSIGESSMKVKTIARNLLILLTVGVPTFIKFDTKGITHEFGLVNVQSLTIIAVFAIVGLFFICLVSLRPVRNSSFHALPNNGWVWIMFYYYGVYLVFSAMVLPLQGFAVAVYRIAEWALIISLCWYYFYTCQNSNSESSDIGDDFISLLRIITSLPGLIVLAGLILFPDLAYTYSVETGTFRLGGHLYHPNRMGTICGIGSVLFWVSAKGKFDRFWSIILFVMMGFTYSRGAMVGFVLYLFYHYFKFSPSIRKLTWSLILLTFLIFSFAISKDSISRGFLSFFSRGEAVDTIYTLNSRNRIWNLSLDAISDSPWIGRGFIQGPKTLASTILDGSWATTHSHNDVLNAGVSGGVFMAAFTLLIYIALTFSTIQLRKSFKLNAATATVLIQCGIYSILTPIFSTSAGNPGTIMLILMGFLYSYPHQQKTFIHLNPNHANSISS